MAFKYQNKTLSTTSKFYFEDVSVFIKEGDFKRFFDKLLHHYGINRNGYWSDFTGGDVRLFLQIFEDKLCFWRRFWTGDKHLTHHIKKWDKVRILIYSRRHILSHTTSFAIFSKKKDVISRSPNK